MMRGLRLHFEDKQKSNVCVVVVRLWCELSAVDDHFSRLRIEAGGELFR